jgi:signal transduction histidine kinase
MRTLRARLILSHLLVTGAALVLLALVTPRVFVSYYLSAEQSRLRGAAEGIASAAGRLWQAPHSSRNLQLLIQTSGAVIGGEVALVENGHIVSASSPGAGAAAWALPEVNKAQDKSRQPATPADYIVITAPVQANGHPVATVVMRVRLAPLYTIRRAQRLVTPLAGGLSALLAILLAWVVSRALSQPLVAMSTAARRVAAGDFSVHLLEADPLEVRTVAAAMNQMAASLAQAFSELAEERALLTDLLAAMEEGVVGLNAEGLVTTANAAARRLLRLPLINGDDWRASISHEWAKRTAAVARGSAGYTEVIHWEGRALQISAAPVQGRGVVLVLADVTEAQRLEQLRRDFVANASHELRAPLTCIRGFLGAVLDGTAESEAEQRHCLEVAADEAARMTRIVEDLLQLSRLQAGVLEFNFAPVDVPRLAADVIASFAPRLPEKQLRLHMEADEHLPLVSADGDRLAQVLVNLLDNALRYSPVGGEITLTVEREGGRCLVTVADQGPGIPQAEVHEVWERFHKADPARPRTDPGAGLGLAIAREIIREHGGEVFARNRATGGAEVGFRLPLTS